MAEDILTALAGIVVLGIAAQWIAWRLDLPAILFMLTLGVFAGPITGFIDPDAMFGELLLPIVSLSVAVILFEGGLTLDVKELRQSGPVILRLVTLGAAVTFAGAALAAALVLGVPVNIAILLGAILIVSGPTVVGPLLRQVRPRGASGAVLKWEGIVIDPIGALMAVLVFEAIIATSFAAATSIVVTSILKTIAFGVILGVAGSFFLVTALRRYWVPDYLHSPIALMAVLAAFGLSERVQPESGLLTVTVMGVVLANQRQAPIRHIIEFKETLRVLLIPALFMVLAARLTLDDLALVDWRMVAFVAVLVFIVRPLSVAISAQGSTLSIRERLFIAAVMPRGIVAAAIASLFALRLNEAGIPGAERLVPTTFFVIIGTVIVYGFGARPIARALGVARAGPAGCLIVGAQKWARDVAKALVEAGVSVRLVDTNANNVRQAHNEGLVAQHENIVSEHAEGAIELEGVGTLFALTRNAEVNTLATLHFARVFGREQVYQLAATERGEHHGTRVPAQLRGRILFGAGATYDSIYKRVQDGATIEIVEVSEAVPPEMEPEASAIHPLPLFLVTKGGFLEPFTDDHQPTPNTGDRLLRLVDPKPKAPPVVPG